jgi:hypothetical protein
MNSLDAEIVVPGHGQIGNNYLIDQMKDYLLDLEVSAQNMINEDRSIEDLDVISPPTKYKEWWFDRFYASNLRFAYETLKASDTK